MYLSKCVSVSACVIGCMSECVCVWVSHKGWVDSVLKRFFLFLLFTLIFVGVFFAVFSCGGGRSGI